MENIIFNELLVRGFSIDVGIVITNEVDKNGKKTLLLTKDGFKKIIITKDAIAPLYNEDGVLVMGLFDFLLDEKSLEI